MNWLNGDSMTKKEACSLDNMMINEKAKQFLND